MFGVLDRWMITVVAQAERRLRPYSWTLGRNVPRALAWGHEGLLGLALRLGWGAVHPKVLEACVRAEVKTAPEYPSFFPPTASALARAEALRRGHYVCDDGKTGAVADLSWLRDPFGERSSLERLRFHALEWVEDLLLAHERVGDPRYLEVARDLSARWISECLFTEGSHNVWSDHGTALRAIILCRLWAAYRRHPAPDPRFLAALLAALARHGARLAYDGFYRPEHNHGVTQAYALLAIGLLFPPLPQGFEWAALGRSRLEAQMADNVSMEGLHREQSPYYHFYALRHFWCAQRLAEVYGSAFSEGFRARLEAMLTAGAYLVKPDGRLCALGDTSRTSPCLADGELLSAEAAGPLRYVRSRGQGGQPPGPPSVVFADGGYAVLRSGWGGREAPEDERYLVVRLSTFPTAHMHRDALSFEFYGYGDDLLVDSGGPYRYADPLRSAYFLATRAHNTVAVDGRDQAVGRGRVLAWHGMPEYDLLLAEHRCAPGVRHRRTFLFVRPRYVIVMDRLVGAVDHGYAQYFHLNPALEATVEGGEVATRHPAGGPTVRIRPLLSAASATAMWRGAVDPHQGWVCGGEGEMVPGGVVEYRARGTEATFAVLLLAEPAGSRSVVEARGEGDVLRGPAAFQVDVDGVHDEIVLGPLGEVRFSRRQIHD